MAMLEILRVIQQFPSRLAIKNCQINRIKYGKKVKSLLNIKSDNEPDYGDFDKCIKAKIKTFGGNVNKNVQSKGKPKEKAPTSIYQ